MGSIRIIAGKWRGRKIVVPDVVGLRPTPNAVRETLFNWLAPVIVDAVCLDLFAGSGALSFEALSRGAKQVIACDCSRKVIKQLKENARLLAAEKNITILQAKIPQQLDLAIANLHADSLSAISSESLSHCCTSKFNLIFLDPPFHQNLVNITCQKLMQLNLSLASSGLGSQFLAPHALIYIEAEKNLDAAILKSFLPSNWQIMRCKTLGQVNYYLISILSLKIDQNHASLSSG